MKINTYLDILYTYQRASQLFYKKFYFFRLLNNILKSILLDFCNQTMYLLNKKKYEGLSNKNWFYVNTYNNRESIKSVYELVDDAVLIETYRIDRKTKEVLNIHLPVGFNRFYSAILLFKELGKDKWALDNFDTVYKATNTYEAWLKFLSLNEPKSIIFTNDHYYLCRALLLAANKLNIKTIYIPHASVSLSFPPLKFDLALLDGRDTLNKYAKIGYDEKKVQIELIGIPKFDFYLKQKKTGRKVKTIGIGIGLLDNLEEVNKLIEEISIKYVEKTIIVRPHPRLKLHKKIKKSNVSYSDSEFENSLDFCLKIDVLIAGNSGIHIEGVMLNVISITYYYKGGGLFDYYNYIKNGVSLLASNKEELMGLIDELIEEKKNVCLDAKYYNESINSSFEGNSSQLASKLIKNKINEK